ncbi:MAG: hypothetical protein PSV35_01390 [bacterium]|nr:hypothetical protein [bacterium]
MPNMLQLKLITDALSESPVIQPNYFLFMMGGDCVFTPAPVAGRFKNGETLSFVAQWVAESLQEQLSETSTDLFTYPDSNKTNSSKSVEVINGAGLSNNVNCAELIVQGLFSALRAIAQGKTNITIAAHGRGALFSILIAHELYRIKNELNDDPNKSFLDILKKSECYETHAAVTKFIEDISFSPELKIVLNDRFNEIKVNLFLMDPIRAMRTENILWEDPRFHVKPPCDMVELLISRDGLDEFAYPLILPETNLIVLPGDYFTATGYLLSQKKTLSFLPAKFDSSLVQKLVVLKLISFINERTGLFEHYSLNHSKGSIATAALSSNDAPASPSLASSGRANSLLLNASENLVLGGEDSLVPTMLQNFPVMALWVHHFLSDDKSQQQRQLLALYDSINAKDDPYKTFAYRTKKVIFGSITSLSVLTDIVQLPSDDFINTDHASLYLQCNTLLKFSAEANVTPSINAATIRDGLKNIFDLYQRNDDSVDSKKMNALLNSLSIRSLLFDAISLLIKQLVQRYLKDQMSLAKKTEVTRIFDEIFTIINVDSTPNAQDPNNQIIADCKKILHREIYDSAFVEYFSLFKRQKTLNNRLEQFIAVPENFSITFSDYLNKLVSLNLNFPLNLLEELRTLNRENPTPESVHNLRRVYRSTLNSIPKDISDLLYKELCKLSAQVRVAGEIHSLADILLADDLILLPDLDKLFENTYSLIYIQPHLQKLANSPLAWDISKLQHIQYDIMFQAASILLRNEVDLSRCKFKISPVFFDLIKRAAIFLGAVNPVEIELRATIAAQNTCITQYETEIPNHLDTIANQNLTIEEQAKTITDQVTIIDQQTKEWNKLKAELTVALEDVEKERLSIPQISASLKQTETILSAAEKNDHQLTTQLRQSAYPLSAGKENHDSLSNPLPYSVAQLNKKQKKTINQLLKTEKQLAHHVDGLTQELKEKEHHIEQLSTAKEVSCARLIDAELAPLTREYRSHLINEAKKLNPSLSLDAISDCLPPLPSTAKPHQVTAYKKLDEKYSAIQQLMHELVNPAPQCLPSQRVTQFTNLLQDHDKQLKQHRNPKWQQYLKNCLVAIGVVCSLIIPGIIGLLAYSAYSKKSSPLFFSKSVGEEYVDKARQTLTHSDSDEKPDSEMSYDEAQNQYAIY